MEGNGERQPGTDSYLLRLWPTGSGQQRVWRASLEQIRTGERWGFANLEQLFVFLMQRTEQDGEAPDTATDR
jgi:hypothetical protein